MLRCDELGDVLHYRMGRSLLGRTLLTTGVFLVDGLLIDTGPSRCSREMETILDRHPVDRVVLTHHHEDHSGNAALAARRLEVTPLAHPATRPLLQDPEELRLYRRVVWGDVPPCETAALGETLETLHHTFEVIHTPGHAPDHVALHEPRRRWLFSGDLFITRRPNVMSEGTDVTVLIDSLRELLKLPDCRMFCQHSGRHDSHQEALGGKLDWLLGLQERAVMHHEEGRGLKGTTRELGLARPLWRWISRGEFSAENLVRELLRDAGVELGAADAPSRGAGTSRAAGQTRAPGQIPGPGQTSGAGPTSGGGQDSGGGQTRRAEENDVEKGTP